MFSDDQNIDRLYANDTVVAVYVGARQRPRIIGAGKPSLTAAF